MPASECPAPAMPGAARGVAVGDRGHHPVAGHGGHHEPRATGSTYVNSSSPSSAASTATRLWVDGSPLRHALLRFDVADTNRPIVHATLRLYVTRSKTSLDVRRVESVTWDEATATWADAPAAGAVVASSGPLTPDSWATVDVTGLVTRPGPVSIAVTTDGPRAQAFDSREGANPPRLLVEYGSAPAPGATTYYLDAVRGNDSNAGTSPSTAWRTLSKLAAASPAPGDRVLLARGSTWTGPLDLDASGTQERPVTVASYGTGTLPVITGSTNCVTIAGSYIVLRRISARDCSWSGVRITGRWNRVERSVITGNATGIQVASGAVGNAIIDNDLIDNKRMSVLTESPTNDDSGAFGILLNGDHTEVAHNRISGSDGFSYDYGRDGAAIEVYGGQYNSIHHNIANQNHAFTELGGSRSTGNVFAFNVVRSTLDTSGFVVTRGGANSRGPVTGTELYRNTVLLTAASSQGVICYGGCSPSILKMRGNIVVAQYRTLYVDRTVDQDYDLFAGSGSVNVATGPHTILANPIFTNAASGNLRLHETSPAVDRGTTAPFPTDADGVPAAQDGNGDGSPTPDVGAYERPASSGVTTTTTKQPTTTVPASTRSSRRRRPPRHRPPPRLPPPSRSRAGPSRPGRDRSGRARAEMRPMTRPSGSIPPTAR